ncbi:MAG: hypothetical protein AAGK05_16255, partial [Pseudomonadota bacterium]
MQVKTLSIAVAAALYSASAAHAVGVDNNQVKHQLKAPNITFEEVKAFSKEINQGDSSNMLQNDGLNVQLNSQANKFT